MLSVPCPFLFTVWQAPAIEICNLKILRLDPGMSTKWEGGEKPLPGRGGAAGKGGYFFSISLAFFRLW